MIFDLISAGLNHAYQDAAAEQAYQRQVEFWNMQNQYNRPSAQVARLKEAGLNPALAYGQGGNVSNTAGQLSNVPKADYQNQNWINFQSSLGMLQQISELKNTEKQRDVMDAQIKNLLANAGNRDAGTDQIRTYIGLMEMQKRTEDLKQKGMISANIAQDLQNELLAVELFYKDATEDAKLRELNSRVDKIISENNLNAEQAKAVRQSISESRARINKITSDIGVNDADISLKNSQLGFTEAQTKYVSEQTRLYAAKAYSEIVKNYGQAAGEIVNAVMDIVNPVKWIGKAIPK